MKPLPCLLCFAAALGGAAAQEGAHWIFGHFKERMDCVYGSPEKELWDDMAVFLSQAEVQQDNSNRLVTLSSTLWDIMLPFGVADPVAALACPLGVSAALYELAVLCVNVHAGQCLQRGLRLLHLSKLFALFNFNDYGAWFSYSRWHIDMNELSNLMAELLKMTRADEGQATAKLAEPWAFREPSWKVGLVTYCNYNDSRTQLTSQSRSNKKAYAARHGYALMHYEEPFVAQAHPWMNKLIAIQENLASFDWLFWVDCDLFFMNPARTVDTLIRTAVLKNPDASLIIAEDGMMLNSGAFLLRNSPWGRDFLASTVDLLAAPMPQSFQHMPWHEQAPLIYLSMVPEVLKGLGGPGGSKPEGSLSAGYDPRVVLVEQRAMNSYPPEVVQKTGHVLAHQAFEEGDMVISFNGCASILGGDFCEAMYAHYHGASMDRFRYAQ
mmetsp:Transcript_39728/g.114651  ORF Transcript_39728/g.114651 Transcript_39728/m.114651 type:complete len:438 (+) Transcript_39728:230-1543(+)